MRKLFLCAIALLLVVPAAYACWDNSDRIIITLKKLELTTDQLKDIFAYQKEHRDVIVRAHSEGLGCRYHEDHDAVFEKKAVGVLTDTQFEKYSGRKRTKVESLEHQNFVLKKEVERLKELIKKLEAELAKAKQK